MPECQKHRGVEKGLMVIGADIKVRVTIDFRGRSFLVLLDEYLEKSYWL